MERTDWRTDDFLRVHLADTASAPKALTGPKFDKQITFIVKLKHFPAHGPSVYRKKAPAWAADVIKNMLDNDPEVQRYFIEEETQ